MIFAVSSNHCSQLMVVCWSGSMPVKVEAGQGRSRSGSIPVRVNASQGQSQSRSETVRVDASQGRCWSGSMQVRVDAGQGRGQSGSKPVRVDAGQVAANQGRCLSGSKPVRVEVNQDRCRSYFQVKHVSMKINIINTIPMRFLAAFYTTLLPCKRMVQISKLVPPPITFVLCRISKL